MSYGVTLDRSHIDSFKQQWLCHNLPASLNRLWFDFADNGDLCGYAAWSRNGRQIELPESVAGGVMLALAEDAQRKIHPEHADDHFDPRD